MSNTYIDETCRYCGKENLICLGRMDDMTAPDVEGFKCWNCGSVRVFDDIDTRPEDAHVADGQKSISVE